MNEYVFPGLVPLWFRYDAVLYAGPSFGLHKERRWIRMPAGL